jgi:hypothetical protein
MKYSISRDVLSLSGEIPLTPEEYATIRKAKRQQIVFLGIEETFDLVLENYAEYERDLYDVAFHHLLYRDLDWIVLQGHRALVNRRLLNLLSAARLYLDQISHDLTTLYDHGSAVAVAVDDARTQQYETKLGYRAMEELRNYVQHRNLPIHGLRYPAQVEEPLTASSKIRYGIVPFLNTAHLEEDKKIKRRIVNELKKRGTNVPVTPLVREYVEGLGAVHEVVRSQTKANVERADETIASVQERAQNLFGEDFRVGLAVVAEDEDNEGVWTEVEHIFDELSKRRRMLYVKNGLLKNLPLRYVRISLEDELP